MNFCQLPACLASFASFPECVVPVAVSELVLFIFAAY
jgi:hypothetical protein